MLRGDDIVLVCFLFCLGSWVNVTVFVWPEEYLNSFTVSIFSLRPKLRVCS